MFRPRLSAVSLGLALLLFLLLGAYQLDLPGLHYDEAKEAGLNAMQLLTGQPVTAFRDATIRLGPWHLPLMVQDYIGALNVVLAVPFLALGGVNVVALRWLPLLTGAGTLALAWVIARRLSGPVAAAVTAMLLAVNPSFVFWSRQGIFVTNLTALLFMASLLTGLRWWESRKRGQQRRWLWLTAFLWGLGVYAKLLFVWAIGAMVVVALTLLVWEWASLRKRPSRMPRTELQPSAQDAPFWRFPWSMWLGAVICFLVPLVPLILFNIRTGGTLISLFGNLGRSYYGVDNSAYLPNLSTRLGQIVTLLRGDQFWYLGEMRANAWAVWLAAGALGVGVTAWVWRWVVNRRRTATNHWTTNHLPAFLLPLALLALAVAQSAFTVSDLFVTHFALLLPLMPLAAGLAVGESMRTKEDEGASINLQPPTLQPIVRVVLLVLGLGISAAWTVTDLQNTLGYHRVLTLSGGLATHSDAINKLATYLDTAPYPAPIALDWGLDAPLRFLTAGRVTPVEVFGYERLDAIDAGFAGRVAPYLTDADNVYLAHAPDKAVFQGRVAALEAATGAQSWLLLQQAWFTERSGNVLFIVYRAIP